MKKILVLLFCLILLVGCGEKNINDGTVSDNLVSSFNEYSKKENNAKKIAENISKDKSIKIAVDVMKVEEGLLDGFDNKIEGFKNAYAIKPMIGSQPFIAYVFETENVVELKEILENNANKRWNICTEADELKIVDSGNYVFLVMSPKSFDE